MSLIIESKPDKISFSKNCIKYTISASEQVETALQFPTNTIQINDYLDEGQSLIVTYSNNYENSEIITFIANNEAALGSLQLPTELTQPLTLLEYLLLMIEYLNANPKFSTYLKASYDASLGNKIIITQESEVDFSLFVGSNPNVTLGTMQSYVAAELKENYRVGVDLYFRKSILDQYKLVYNSTYIPDADNQLEFNLSQSINNEVEALIPQIEMSYQSIFQLSEMLNLFYIKVYSLYGSPPELQTLNTDVTELKVKFGGNYLKDWNKDNNLFKETAEYAAWLTSLPNKLIIGENQQQFLTFYKTFSRNTVRVRCYYNTGTTINYTLSTSLEETPVNDINTLDVSWQNLLTVLSPTLADQIYKYEIIIYEVDGTGPSGNNIERLKKEFILDCNHYENIRDYYYANRYGCIEVFRATGVHSKQLETKRLETVNFNFGNVIGSTGIDSQFAHYSKLINTGNSGFITSKEHIEALIDFMNTDYLWLKDGEDFCPIRLIDKKFPVTADDKYLNDFTFKYELNINPVDFK